ncbi:sterol desaturase family protein [Nostoc sphaeroides CHAB 2801]|uniref:sterol desaturase family protein n=1 Tax=Nostoc sphaeroides TaxID=446679 RepID=UPI000E492E62|nr:sterol desaturase family protein [Nostoc sphaeroides]MCC5631136.1 sterol desaturase family protein [Nostoc sphaeroides CHAB 2801]
MNFVIHLIQQFLIPFLTLLISGTILWLWEIKQPFRKIQHLPIFLQDIRELPIIFLFIVLSAQIYSYISDLFIFPIIEAVTHSVGWTSVLHLPLWFRLIIAILIKDLIAYFNHWFMHHTFVLWRVHKWHHLQKPMYWLKGNKNSLIAKIIAKSDFIAFPILAIPLDITFTCVLAYSFFTFFVHSNIQWLPWMRTVEWILVTPRYHLIHHSADIQYQHKNLGDIFTFCDRIFGTYIDPETFDPSHEQFGLDEDESLTPKMIIGL